MIPLNEILLFAGIALVMVLSPGPNMIYLISRSMSQGKKAGIISLLGVMCGFLFHILMVSFGLTAIFLAIPYAFVVVKFLGIIYLLYLAFDSIASKNDVFSPHTHQKKDTAFKLFNMGLLTNVLNPKAAILYLSLLPQFIKPEYGSIFQQGILLGFVQMIISFIFNFLIVISAAKMASWFAQNIYK